MRAFFFTDRGFGDLIVRTPCMRQVHRMGYDVVIVLENNYHFRAALDQLTWINQFVSFDEVEGLITDQDIVVYAGWQPKLHRLRLLSDRIYSPENPFTKKTKIDRHSLSLTQFILNEVGLDPFYDYLPEIGFQYRNMELPNNTVITNVAGDPGCRYGKNKAMHPLQAVRIRDEIEKSGYHLLVTLHPLSQDVCKSILEQYGVQYLSTEKTTDSVLAYLNSLSQSIAMIGPDGGLLHAAAALRHPTIYLETYYPAAVLFNVWDHLVINSPLQRWTCQQTCVNPNKEPIRNGHVKCIVGSSTCSENLISVGCLTSFDPSPIRKALDILLNRS